MIIPATTGSIASSATSATVPANTALPTIDNTTPKVGDVLNATSGDWTGSPTSYSYQWSNSGVIDGATSGSYTAQASDDAQTLTISVVATNTSGDSIPASSAATSVVTFPAPVNTSAPAIISSGDISNPLIGDSLSCDNGTWNNMPSDYDHQWKWEDGTVIFESHGVNSYTIGGSDSGHQIHCTVVATNDGGSTSADTNATGTAG